MERFEEWFAVRTNHKDEEFWPSRLTYDPNDGISLSAINFAEPKLWRSNSTFEAETITGYLGYQRPATIVEPFIQSSSPGSIGPDTQVVRAQYSVVANGILKNLHLTSLSERCFIGLRVQLPSLHAWIAPNMVTTQYSAAALPSVSVKIGESSRREFELSGGVRAEVFVYASADDDGGNYLPVQQHSVLWLTLPEPVSYEEVLRISSTLDSVFNFLIGTRLEAAVCHLPTTQTQVWNDKERPIVAESWIVPAWKRSADPPHRKRRMFTEATSPTGLKQLLELCLTQPTDLTYLMEVVLGAEMSDLRPDDCFVELLGCLEDFDKERYGSGADPTVRLTARRIRALVSKYGSEEEKAVCDQIGRSFRNEFSLRQRLNRLRDIWSADGFRGRPDPARLVEIRNIKPHGRGRQISPSLFKEIVDFLPFLCALARYHVLRTLGFDRSAIAQGFDRLPFRYGAFAPR